MRAVRIHSAASEEAIAAARWYEAERKGLGVEFEHAINAALDLLEQDVVPLAVMIGTAGDVGAKRLLLRRFPYAVIVVERNSEVLVVAFAHHSRHPGYWRNRIST